MQKVLIVCEQNMATVELLRTTLGRLFPDGTLISFKCVRDISERDIEECDILFMTRSFDILSKMIADEARKAGVFTAFYLDDDLISFAGRSFFEKRRCNALLATLEAADVFLTPCRALLEKYGKRSKCPAILDTIVSAGEICANERSNTNPVKIVFAAGHGHEKPFEDYVVPILSKIGERFGAGISLTFIGVAPRLPQDYPFEVRFIDHMRFDEYRDYMRHEKFDIGLAPLLGTSFDSCKYHNKYIEYSLAGCVGIYSDCKPFSYVISNAVNGILAKNSPDDWYEAIERAVSDKELRQNCLEGACKDLIERQSAKAVRETLLKEVPGLFEYRRTSEKKVSLGFTKYKYRFWVNIEYFTQVWKVLTKDGLPGLWKKVLRHIKNSKAIHS